MNSSVSAASAGLLVLVACSNGAADADQRTAVPPAAEQEIDPKSLVKLRLVADVDGLAALFEIKDGWHIYWINPGTDQKSYGCSVKYGN